MFITCKKKKKILPHIPKDHPHCLNFNAKKWNLARASAKEGVGVSSLGSLRMLYANGKEETKQHRQGGEQTPMAPKGNIITRKERADAGQMSRSNKVGQCYGEV